MDNSASPLDTLRQLKEMLDAGALTPTEFEALKQQLVFSKNAAAALPATPPAEAAVPAAPLPPAAISLPPPPAPEQPSPMFEAVAGPAPAGSPSFSAPIPAPPTPSAAPPVVGASLAPEAPARGWATDEFPDSEAPAARSPLALVLSIGGLLALLGLVLYLALNRPPSEHLSSTSQTAADSVAVPIETGPQVEQLPLPAAAPETIRIAPARPATPLPARPAPAVTDSAAPAPAALADSAAGQ